eukprot:TRINITY_DN16418_c1_g1_i1.p4 TRINITY_DN16418_c1_g1~~TRINITY_DN16418_c1_g1_i1.p4  ORF type:complete len:135 (-),score=28.09 TRINITY_DN16418_c1_g1_i1:28-393(-)
MVPTGEPRALEVAHAVLEVWEPGRVGYRVSPMAEGDEDPQDLPIDTYAYLATELGKLGLAYIHVVEAFRDSARDDESEQVFGAVRKAFRDAGKKTKKAEQKKVEKIDRDTRTEKMQGTRPK